MTIPSIHGVLLTDLREISDERGSVLHHLRNDSSDFHAFGEAYFSEILPGATKAWKRHRAQTQNLAVPVGRVRFAIYDDRTDSPTSGSLYVIELGRPDDYRRLTIPRGLWYGFQCLGDRAALIANVADLPHHPDDGELRDQDDAGIPYSW